MAAEGFDDPGPDLAASSGDEDAHGWEVYGAALPRLSCDSVDGQGQGSVAVGARVVVVGGGAVVTGAPGTVLGARSSWSTAP